VEQKITKNYKLYQMVDRSTKMKLKATVVLLVFLAYFASSCEQKSEILSPAPVNFSELGQTSYAVIARDQNNTPVLLGVLGFDSITEDEITGHWRFETWGKQRYFSTLPLNANNEFPEVADLGTFQGLIWGDQAILKIQVPETENSLGLILEGRLDNTLVGTISLLPEKQFDGRFEALRIN
jgi:hypothetical protein